MKLNDKRAFDEAGKFLEESNFGLAVVARSTVTGDTEKDRVLTEARAKVIRDYLAQHFKLDDTWIKAIGLGKSKQARHAGKVQILVYAAKPVGP